MGQARLGFRWRGAAGILPIAILGLFSTAMARCVFPDGVGVNTDYVPCTNSEGSNCCHKNDKCRANGFCLSTLNGYHYRGGCTDMTYKSPSCPTQCQDSATGEFRRQFAFRIQFWESATNSYSTELGNASFVNIIACDAAQNGGTWCCAYDGNCCDDDVFQPEWGDLFDPVGAAVEPPSTSVGSSPPSSTNGQTAPKDAASDKAEEPSNTGKVPSSGGDNKTAVAVGASLGAVIFLLCLVFAVVFWRTRRKQQVPESPIPFTIGPYKEQPLVAEVAAERPRHELPTSRG